MKEEYLEIAELIGMIRRHPLMYLANHSIKEFRAFLAGFTCCKSIISKSSKDSNNNDLILSQFRDWIAEKYGVEGSHGWMSILLFFHINESHALDKFFELWDEFIIEYEQKLGDNH